MPCLAPEIFFFHATKALRKYHMPVLNAEKGIALLRFNRLPGLGLAFLFTLLTMNVWLFAQDPLSREYQVKAVFLYNFTQFVQWPQEAFPEPDSPLVIGILGEDPFGSYLDETVKGESLAITLSLWIDTPALMMSENAISYLSRRTGDNLKVQPVLTVSDVEGFTRMGGMIRFLNDNGRIKLRINVDSASDAELVISSKLLRLAEIVSEKK